MYRGSTSNLLRLFHLVLVAAVAVIGFVPKISGQNCDINQAFDDIISCYAENPCTCFNCDSSSAADNLDPTTVTCDDLNRLLCPEINCCSACSTVLRDVYQCLVVDTFALLGVFGGVGQTCNLDCRDTPFVDEVDTTCDPSDYECVGLYADYLSCYVGCEPSDGCLAGTGAAFSTVELDETIRNAALNDDECAVVNAVACPPDGSPIDDCCPQCDELLANFYQCQVNLDFENPCDVGCATVSSSGVVTTDPVTGPTPSPTMATTPTTTDGPPISGTTESPASSPSGGNSFGNTTNGTSNIIIPILFALAAVGGMIY